MLAEALFLAFGPAQIEAFSKTGMPDSVRFGLAWSEIVGSVLFLVPPATATGVATVRIYSGTVLRSVTQVQIEAVAPGLFTANSDGKGAPAALLVQGHTVSPVFECGTQPGSCLPAPIRLSNAPAYLLLFGTGIRNRSALTAVDATIGDVHPRVEYAGPQNQYEGLDQVNLVLPPELAGRGLVDLVLTVDSRPANRVQLNLR